MEIDAQLYRAASKEYRQWNEVELKARARNAAHRSPGAGWKEFNALWDLAQAMGVKPSHYQRTQKLEALDRYYERVKMLEAWRRAREQGTEGRTSASSPLS